LDHLANWQRHLSSAEDYTNMNMTCCIFCGIRSKHSNISKEGRGHIKNHR